MIGLLGRRDAPTDGVADYSDYLKKALARQHVVLEIVEVPWDKRGWINALRWLSRESEKWRGDWVLLQYTALAWSRRGLPFGALAVLWLVRNRRAHCITVFHDVLALHGTRLRDRIRNRIQNWAMQKLFEFSARGVFTVPTETVPWIPTGSRRGTFIPIGANIPEHREKRAFDASKTPKIIAVFSVTGGETRSQEVEDIMLAARRVEQDVGQVRLEVFGRGAEDARQLLEQAVNGSSIDLRIRGVIPAAEITRTLASAHALLCVRGLTTSRRSTSIAGIACGVPVVGYGQRGSDPAIDAAGVRLVPWHDSDSLAEALVQTLTDGTLWQEMHERSLRAQAEYFSWDAVARRFASMLESRVVQA